MHIAQASIQGSTRPEGNQQVGNGPCSFWANFLGQLLPQQHSHLFAETLTLAPLTQGALNTTLLGKTADAQSVVIRVHQKDVLLGDIPGSAVARWSRAHKEAWVATKLREREVGASEFLSIGYIEPDDIPAGALHHWRAPKHLPWTYSVQTFIEGQPISSLTEGWAEPAQHCAVAAQIGRLMKKTFHGIATSGFGHVLSPDSQQFNAPDWRTYWHSLIPEHSFSTLKRPEILGGRLAGILKDRFDVMCEWDVSPALNHGDARPYNVLMRNGDLVAIDFELSSSGPTPEWDLARLLNELHPFSAELSPEFQGFLQGLDISHHEYQCNFAERARTLALCMSIPMVVLMMQTMERRIPGERTFIHPESVQTLNATCIRDFILRCQGFLE